MNPENLYYYFNRKSFNDNVEKYSKINILLFDIFNVVIIIKIIIIIIILLKQDYKIQLANNKIQMAWLTSWLVVG